MINKQRILSLSVDITTAEERDNQAVSRSKEVNVNNYCSYLMLGLKYLQTALAELSSII